MNERYWAFTESMLRDALDKYSSRASGQAVIRDFLSSPEARDAKLFADIHIVMPKPIGITGQAETK